jgi:hypothetical protein
MDASAKRAAIAAYKERKPAYGVYAVICHATGEAWVGQSRHLDTQQNSLWFALKHGRHPYRSLRAAWDLHGEAAFKFEELERLREDFSVLNRPSELKRRQGIWVARLQAAIL